MHEKRTAVSIHSAGSSFDDHLNPDHIELRSRTKATSGNNIGGGWRRDDDSPTNPLNGNSSFSSSNRVVVDHQIQPDETLTSIALLYSVQVGEIKRANNLVADQDIFGLPSIRIPVSRLKKEILMNSELKNGEQEQVSLHQHCNKPSSSSPNSVVPEVKQNWGNNLKTKVINNRYMPHSSRQYNKDDFEVPLLGDYDDEYGMAGTEEAKEAIEDLFEKSDATVAAARENLPSPSLEGGAFHFIDATAPDNTQRNIWLLVMLVILIFVVIPLVLTFLEEKSEAEEALHSHRHHSSSQMVS